MTSAGATTRDGALPPNATRLPQTNQLKALYTIIRDQSTPRADFIFYSDRIIRLLVEEGLNHLPVSHNEVITPTGKAYEGEAMEAALRECCRSVRIGKILIQRDEDTARPKLFYVKLPSDVEKRWVLLLDPCLATGGSALKAIEVLISHGVAEERIIFLNVLSSPEGLEVIHRAHPKLRVISGWVDDGLDAKKYIVPGCGDFGQRYWSE